MEKTGLNFFIFLGMKYIKSIDENHLVMDGHNFHPGSSDE